jgi:hypothetical protein
MLAGKTVRHKASSLEFSVVEHSTARLLLVCTTDPIASATHPFFETGSQLTIELPSDPQERLNLEATYLADWEVVP